MAGTNKIKVNYVSNYLGMAVDKCRFQEPFCSSKDYNEVQPESRQVSDPLHANDETFRIKNVEKIDNFTIFFRPAIIWKRWLSFHEVINKRKYARYAKAA